MRECLDTGIHKHVPQVVDHLLNLLYHGQELSTTLLLHDLSVPSFNRSSVDDSGGAVWQSRRLNDFTSPVVDKIGEIPSYGADSIQLRYSDEMNKHAEQGQNLVFGFLAARYGRRWVGGLNSMKKIIRASGAQQHCDGEIDRPNTAHVSPSSGVLRRNRELS